MSTPTFYFWPIKGSGADIGGAELYSCIVKIYQHLAMCKSISFKDNKTMKYSISMVFQNESFCHICVKEFKQTSMRECMSPKYNCLNATGGQIIIVSRKINLTLEANRRSVNSVLSTAITNLLGQEASLQLCEFLLDPTQFAPPWLGTGFEQVLWRSFVPPPHVTEQCPQAPQADQEPSTSY